MEIRAHVLTGTRRSSHSEYATGLNVQLFEYRQRLELLSSPKLPGLLWDHPASYPMGTEVLCRVGGGGKNGRDVKLTAHLHLVPRLRMTGAIS